MIATGARSMEQAADLLKLTSRNNPTSLVASPRTVTGYSLTGALSILGRCNPHRIWVEHRKGQPILVADLTGHGVHEWYLRMEPPPANPWA